MIKRKKWLMKHPIQAKYLLLLLVAMLTPTLILGFAFYNLIFYLLAKQLAFPEAVSANLIPVIDQVNQLLILILPLVFLIILIAGVFMSHRFAGPIERLESGLDRILSGDHLHKLRLRKKDDLAGVADRINRLVEVFKKK